MNGEVEGQRHFLVALGDKRSSISEAEMLRMLQEGCPRDPGQGGIMMARADPTQTPIMRQNVCLLHDTLSAGSSVGLPSRYLPVAAVSTGEVLIQAEVESNVMR
jgi:hypothetical protein